MDAEHTVSATEGHAERALVEPIPGEPAAIAEWTDGRALVIADYHAGLEARLGRRGVSLPSHAEERREHLVSVLAHTEVDRVIVLGDLAHAIGGPEGVERAELETLLSALTERVPVTVVKGNHDGEIEAMLEAGALPDVTVTPTAGVRYGAIGFAHGHTWPSREVLCADVVCVGHEHPTVRLEDAVGGSRAERAWLRGRLDPEPFETHFRDENEGEDVDDGTIGIDGELVVFPAFNDLTGGTWVNVEGQGFLAPFLPDGLAGGEAYLLDGTRLGAYRRV